MDITCETMMGAQFNAQKDESIMTKCTNRLLEIALQRLFKIWYHFDFIFMWTRLYKENQVLLEKCNLAVDEIIKQKEQSVKNESPSLLDFLLDLSPSSNSLTTDEIRDEIKTFIIAAFDTTAVVSCFAITMLAMHPDVQNRVCEEVFHILGPDGTVECKDLPYLKYTELVIKETLRLFPPAPYLAREVVEDLHVDEDVTLPKGSILVLGVLHVHRNSEYWSEPLKFDPERFLPEEIKKRHPGTYLPFSAGPMNCIGQKYAMMSMMTMIATLIRKFKFHTTYKTIDEIKLTNNIILRPRDGFKSYIRLRNESDFKF